MNTFRTLVERFFPPHRPLPAGVYTYTAPPDAEFPYRLHLRIEPDGRGVLILNGSTVIHLNQTAAEYTYHLILNTPPEQAAAQIAKRYNIQESQALADYQNLVERLRALIEVPDLDPVTYLDFDREEPYSGAISAPYRLDCALTYRLPDSGYQQYVPADRVKDELPHADWQVVLQKAWEAGIPHVVFTGGEPTLRPDLPDLVGFASKLGMVTGVITNGLRFAERDYLHQMLQASLDHMMLILDPVDEASWEALRDCLAEDLAVAVHLTLTSRDRFHLTSIVDRLSSMGVQKVSLSAGSRDLFDLLPTARQTIAERGLTLVWDLPVPYSRFNPVSLELAQTNGEIPPGAGKAWLYVEPDGDVLLSQGVPRVLGNLLRDSWETIWKNVRQREE